MKKILYCFLGKDKVKLSLGLMITKTIKVRYIIIFSSSVSPSTKQVSYNKATHMVNT